MDFRLNTKVYIFQFSTSDNFPSRCNYIFLKHIFWTCLFSLLDLSSILFMATSCFSFKASWNGISSLKQILTSVSSISPFCLCAPECSARYRANARHHHHHHMLNMFRFNFKYTHAHIYTVHIKNAHGYRKKDWKEILKCQEDNSNCF